MGNARTIDDSGSSPDRPGGLAGDELCRPFVELLSVRGASISVIGRRARRVTVCSSDPVAARLEGLQFDLGEGPQWEVMKTGMPVLSADLSPRATEHWPVFGTVAARLGAAALFAFPIAMGAVTVGVIDLYRTTPGALDAGMVALAHSLAHQVASAAVTAAIRFGRRGRCLGGRGHPHDTSRGAPGHRHDRGAARDLRDRGLFAVERSRLCLGPHDGGCRDRRRRATSRLPSPCELIEGYDLRDGSELCAQCRGRHG